MHDSKFRDFSEDSYTVDCHADGQLQDSGIQPAACLSLLTDELERSFYSHLWDMYVESLRDED